MTIDNITRSTCPSCGTVVRLTEAQRGKKLKCRKCSAISICNESGILVDASSVEKLDRRRNALLMFFVISSVIVLPLLAGNYLWKIARMKRQTAEAKRMIKEDIAEIRRLDREFMVMFADRHRGDFESSKADYDRLVSRIERFKETVAREDSEYSIRWLERLTEVERRMDEREYASKYASIESRIDSATPEELYEISVESRALTESQEDLAREVQLIDDEYLDRLLTPEN